MAVLHTRECHCHTSGTTIYRSTAHQNVPLQHQQNSIPLLYCTVDSATVSHVEQDSIALLHSRHCHCSTSRTAIYRSTAQQTLLLQHQQNSNISLYCTPASATVAQVEQQSIAVLHTRKCHSTSGRTAINRCIAQQTVPLQHRQNSNLTLYFTPDSATIAPVEQQSISVLHSKQ